MDSHIKRIRKWAAEARFRHKQSRIRLDVDAVMGDIDFLTEQIRVVQRDNDELTKQVEFGKAVKVELARVRRQHDHDLQSRSEDAKRQNDMAHQINNAMEALKDEKIPEWGGEMTMRIALRIKQLAGRTVIMDDRRKRAICNLEAESKKLAAVTAIVVETHKALDEAQVPCKGGTVIERLQGVLEDWKANEGIRKSCGVMCTPAQSVSDYTRVFGSCWNIREQRIFEADGK